MDVLDIADAPNWAATRFGLAASEFDMRIMRGALGCGHIGISYLRFGPGWRSTLGHGHPAGEEVYPIDDPELTELAPGFWPADE